MDFRRVDLPRQISNLDHRNLYSIKRMINNLINEFDNSLENKDKMKAKQILEFTKQLYLKIHEPYPMWAKKLDLAVKTMDKRVANA